MERVLIQTGESANLLLKHGFKIIEVRPHKKNKIRSVYVFDTCGKPEVVIKLVANLTLKKQSNVNLFD